jgi:hypothetical protein
MIMRFLSALVLASSLVGAHECAIAQDELSSFRSKCTEYGFTPGSDAHAQCVQKLDREAHAANNQQQAQQCEALRKQVDYWCSNAPARNGMNASGALQCGQLTATFRRACAASSDGMNR